jgi:hypothetical protein
MTVLEVVVMITETTDFVVTGINSFLVTEEDVTYLECMMITEDAITEETTAGDVDATENIETASVIYSGKINGTPF